jgi:hypothetical protein
MIPTLLRCVLSSILVRRSKGWLIRRRRRFSGRGLLGFVRGASRRLVVALVEAVAIAAAGASRCCFVVGGVGFSLVGSFGRAAFPPVIGVAAAVMIGAHA